MDKKTLLTRLRVRKYRANKRVQPYTRNNDSEQNTERENAAYVEDPGNVPLENDDLENLNDNFNETNRIEEVKGTDVELDVNYTDDESSATSSDSYYSVSSNCSSISSRKDYDVIEPEINNEKKSEEKVEVTLLRTWALKSQCRHKHLNELLQILRKRLIPELPSTSTTFLKTSSANYNIIDIENDKGTTSHYVYFSIKKGLENCINADLHTDGNVALQINIDGLPLYKSSSISFWPILIKVHFEPDIYSPFPVGMYCGEGKPKDIEVFLKDFIAELNFLSKNGILIDNKHFNVSIKCFICDTPARAFLKCIKGHNGYYACERCDVSGESIKTKKGRKVVYPVLGDTRTDKKFRKRDQKKHHVGTSPLLKIRPKIDFIKHFILDFMHLLCLGVMKKLLELWTQSNLVTNIGARDKRILSNRMEKLKKQVPIEFSRKPRTTDTISRWKATEFRFFLLYCGPIVLKSLLKTNLYKHFLLLHVSSRILCCKHSIMYKAEAKKFLNIFFLLVKKLYGKSAVVMNMHNVAHIADDAINMNCDLNAITAFPFENILGKLKRLLCSGNRPLAQVCRRLHELYFANKNVSSIPNSIEILKRDLRNVNQIIKLKYHGFTLTTKSPDNIVLLKNNICLEIKELLIFGNEVSSIIILGTKLKKEKSMFIYPLDSNILQMWMLKKQSSGDQKQFSLAEVEFKMIKLQQIEGSETKTYVMPLLH